MFKNNEEREVLSKINSKKKAETFSATVISAMIYECETWAPTAAEHRKLETTVTAMERTMPELTFKNRIETRKIQGEPNHRKAGEISLRSRTALQGSKVPKSKKIEKNGTKS